MCAAAWWLQPSVSVCVCVCVSVCVCEPVLCYVPSYAHVCVCASVVLCTLECTRVYDECCVMYPQMHTRVFMSVVYPRMYMRVCE